MNKDTITIVSGLPRSGTSMMMRMLEAGGIPLLTDHIRTPDESNPKGYYEFERVKKLPEDQGWLQDAKGRATKVISWLLMRLPIEAYHYKIIFMHREITEILSSQAQMLIQRGERAEGISDESMAALFQKHLRELETWLATQANMEVIYLHYNKILANPAEHLGKINQFLGNTLDPQSMMAVIDHALYRQRRNQPE